jgi:predicted DNA-binding transcriptional regulator AlpA
MSAIVSTEVTALPIRWLRIPDAIRYSGLSRSLLYQLIADGSLRSICIRRRGSLRGARVLSAESIDEFLERHVDERKKQAQAAAEVG